mmetsp:Transcript_95680/g.308882  ORF Transcript_95680/g.308882 Transcript_95680/m.308882 type:complete len:395 (-) Transcript_95680:185-1369(-)
MSTVRHVRAAPRREEGVSLVDEEHKAARARLRRPLQHPPELGHSAVAQADDVAARHDCVVQATRARQPPRSQRLAGAGRAVEDRIRQRELPPGRLAHSESHRAHASTGVRCQHDAGLVGPSCLEEALQRGRQLRRRRRRGRMPRGAGPRQPRQEGEGTHGRLVYERRRRDAPPDALKEQSSSEAQAQQAGGSTQKPAHPDGEALVEAPRARLEQPDLVVSAQALLEPHALEPLGLQAPGIALFVAHAHLRLRPCLRACEQRCDAWVRAVRAQCADAAQALLQRRPDLRLKQLLQGVVHGSLHGATHTRRLLLQEDLHGPSAVVQRLQQCPELAAALLHGLSICRELHQEPEARCRARSLRLLSQQQAFDALEPLLEPGELAAAVVAQHRRRAIL